MMLASDLLELYGSEVGCQPIAGPQISKMETHRCLSESSPGVVLVEMQRKGV